MKKIHYLAICLLATGLAACTQNEEISSLENQKAITFDTYVGRDAATRASVIVKTDLEDDGFGVFGYYTTGDWTTSATPNFMYNQKVSGEDWGYEPLKYWPATGKISFFAYAPYDEDAELSANTEAGTPTLTYTVPDAVGEQIDLLVAGAQKDKTGNTVEFSFKHALSRIGFGVKLANSTDFDAATAIDFSKITLSADFYPSATLTLDLDGDNVQWADEATAARATYTLNNTEDTNDNIQTISTLSTTDTAPINNTSSYLMVLPQDFSGVGDEMEITANFSLSTEDEKLNGGEFTANYEFTGKVALELEAGKAYTIVLVLGKTADTDGDGDIDDDDDSVLVPVKFAVDEVEDWADSTPKDYELPQDVPNNN